MRQQQINIVKYAVTIMTALGIFFSQAPAVLPVTTYDPDTVMEPGGYNKDEEYVIKKSIEPPKSRHTDSSGYEERQIAHYQKKYKNLPSSWVAYLYKQCAQDPTCNIDKLLMASSRETAHLLRRPTIWSKAKTQIIAYFAANLRASRAKRATPTKGLLIAWLEKFAFWKKDNIAGEFLQKNIVTPTVAMVKYAEKGTKEFMIGLAKSSEKANSLLVKPDPERLRETEPNWRSYQNNYARFKYAANDPRVPAAYKEVYGWAINGEWNPQKHPENYVECVAFVAMVYNENGVQLRVPGNAIDWKDNAKVFNIYNSGSSTVPPQLGDVLVWDDIPEGHVAVVTKLKETEVKNIHALEVTQGNSTEVKSKYLIQKIGSSYSIINSEDGTQRASPKWWLRVK